MQIELKQLQEKLGVAFVFVTHDQEEAMAMADRIAVMSGGRIEQLGTGADIYRKPATRFVAEFIGETNLIPVTMDPDGDLRVSQPSAVGGPLASVRPEHLRIEPRETSAADDDCIRLNGTIEAVTTIGGVTNIHVAALGHALTGRRLGLVEDFAVGQPVTATFRPQDAHMLAGDMR